MFFFKPVLTLMNRARYAHKFLLIFAVFMLPYCWLSAGRLLDVNATLKQSQHELQGLRTLEQYLPVYRLALEQAGMHVIGYARNKDDAKQEITRRSQALVSAIAALNTSLDAGPFADMKLEESDPGLSMDKKLSLQGLSSQMIEHASSVNDLNANMREIAALSKLSQDNNPRIYRNVDLLLNQLLPLYEVLNQTRTYAGYMTAYGFLESSSRSAITNQLSDLQRYAGGIEAKGNAEAQQLMTAAARVAAEQYKREIVDTYTRSGYFNQNAVEQWLQRYDSYAPQAAQLDQATNLLLEETAGLLQARTDANQRGLMLWACALLLVIALLVYLFIGFYLSVRGAIRDLTSATRRMAEGDLRQRVQTAARDELGDLAEDFNDMQARMSELIAQVARFSETTLDKAQSVSDSASTSQRSVERQASELELIATSMSQLVSNVQEVSQNSHVTADKANSAGEKCREGRVQVDHAVERINQLFSEMDDSIAAITSVEKESQEIAKAVDLIKSVAEQTNLLALNAAIEAARAGEQGRGFAVVADEVRNLAIRSHQLTGEIDRTIARLRQQVGSAVETIRGSHQSAARSVEQITLTANIFEQITGSMNQIIDHNIQIASAAEQQAAVVQGVEQNTLEIKSLSDSNAHEAQSTVSVSDELTGMTRDLHGLIANFKV
ncbi:methyl-accepting chemotaxis protein [Ectopseudomonas mendocina]|uniref:methyl-accepting chemotaxis protein n=1 Tax=Ectopseudomonas mendocina TaxID=300 RepID=UPI0023EC61C3|nr:methyl-accepting chemotaxis protein [Pseudomonas mendocina]